MNYVSALKDQFNGFVQVNEKRQGVHQLIAPLYHEDGDPLDIFLEPIQGSDRMVKISDFGMTLMRLSYYYDIDTDNKRRILQTIVDENLCSIIDGHIFLETDIDKLYTGVMQISQAIAKVSSMRAFKQEEMLRLFEETFEQYVNTVLAKFGPIPSYQPLAMRPEHQVDYKFGSDEVPLFLFKVKGDASARLVGLACQAFQLKNLSFKSFVVHREFKDLSSHDKLRITSVADKQFITMDDFQLNAPRVFSRELTAA